jgi:hypothetical protein
MLPAKAESNAKNLQVFYRWHFAVQSILRINRHKKGSIREFKVPLSLMAELESDFRAIFSLLQFKKQTLTPAQIDRIAAVITAVDDKTV